MVVEDRVARWRRHAYRLLSFGLQWFRDQFFATYERGCVERTPILATTTAPTACVDPATARLLRRISERYLAHRFDVLGSGWCRWDVEEPVLVNRANVQYAYRVAEALPHGYVRIDWHCDARAGYRFPPRRWSRFIRPAPAHDVDIKLPWELSRMQHLVQLALVAVDRSAEAGLAMACEAEIGNQIRDFVASNPPRFGVNWRVAMDVAIRAANWTIAVALLDAGGCDTSPVRGMLGRSLRDHGRFIITHLEWHPEIRGNHYLADVCGLAFIAAALPSDAESDAWLAFAVGEVLAEGVRQVNEDGSGFEGSTAYHRLSLDMLVHTVALLLGIDAQRWRALRGDMHLPRGLPMGFVAAEIDWERLFGADGRLRPPQALVQRLWRAAGFTRAVTRPDGRALLIGDNDSGRFVKPCPRYEVIDTLAARMLFPDRFVEPDEGEELRELGEDHTHLVRAIEALFGDSDTDNDSIDARLIRWLTAGRTLPVPRAHDNPTESFVTAAVPAPPGGCNTLRLPFPRHIDLARVMLHAYPGWGLYLLKGDDLLLSFRCGPLGLSGTGNHDHNDQLGLTLHLDGRDWIADPGTYRYTADLAERDAYRSVKAHFAPRLRDSDAEPGSLTEGTWRLGDQARAILEQATHACLQGRHQGYGGVVHRRIDLFTDSVLIRDWSEDGLSLMPLTEQFAALNRDGSALPFCPDYGVRRA